ncbi:MAG: glycosyltransferase family 39 protein [Planctomycetia bacterium]|nr:glycosyltransferase family 39 protein [Planctomycetia bacterium]
MTEPAPSSTSLTPARWLWDFLLLAGFAGLFFFLPVPTLPLRGEETRRAQAAREMVETGVWLYPQQQRQLYLTKPPLLYWLIASVAEVRGKFDRWTVRLPSVVATALVMLLLYVYGRCTVSRLVGWCAALSYGTTASILDKGVSAEIEAVFILFIAGSLLVWHLGYVRCWPPLATWVLGYLLAALGMLTKGLQAPCYFAGAVTVYLAWRRDWRFLLHWSHAVGLVLFALVVGAWLVPCAQQVGLAPVLHTFTGDTVSRIFTLQGFLAHLARYPLETFANLLPWSVVLAWYTVPACRRELGRWPEAAAFALVCVAVAFPTCWLPVGAQPRYFTPLYPSLAVLMAVVLDAVARSEAGSALRRSWRLALLSAAGIMLLAGFALVIARFGPYAARLRVLPGGLVMGYLVAGAAAAVLLLRWRGDHGVRPVALGVALIALFFGVTHAAVIVPVEAEILTDLAGPVAAVHAQLPPGHRLVSLERLYHGFTFHYPEPIPVCLVESQPPSEVAAPTWFCIDAGKGGSGLKLPFAWETVTVVSLDRLRKDAALAQRTVVVGRWLPREADTHPVSVRETAAKY